MLNGFRRVVPVAVAALNGHGRVVIWPVAALNSPCHLAPGAPALLDGSQLKVTRAVEHFSGPGGPPAYLRPTRR
ncbi:hypothetical protein GCM10028824_09370 [Hymenobacter segetis]